MFIFKLSGKYFGFTKDDGFYSASGSYLGWVENGHVWDKDGQYRGKILKLNSNYFILKDSLLVDPSARPPRSGVQTEQLQPQLDIAPMNVEFNLKDGF